MNDLTRGRWRGRLSARPKRRVVKVSVRLLAPVLALTAAFACSMPASAGVGVATCNQARWCTVTAAGDVTRFASQLAIGNVGAGTALAVTEREQQQVGGEILGGDLRGTCAWSQYQRDWTAKSLSVVAGCAHPLLNSSQFVAADGKAIWTGCYPRCFGGVPLRYDSRCGTRGHDWCYASNCEEYANFYPWSPSAHPSDPLRLSTHQQLDLRYLARYGDAWLHTPFYLVRDTTAVHGTGNWVFISGVACGISAGPPGTYRWLPHPKS